MKGRRYYIHIIVIILDLQQPALLEEKYANAYAESNKRIKQ